MEQELILRRDDGTVVCEGCTLAGHPLARLRGLLGREGLEPGEGILLRPASSIHTFFMRFPIDAVFLDGELVRRRESQAESSPGGPPRAAGRKAVLELPSGESARRGLAVGDQLTLAA